MLESLIRQIWPLCFWQVARRKMVKRILNYMFLSIMITFIIWDSTKFPTVRTMRILERKYLPSDRNNKNITIFLSNKLHVTMLKKCWFGVITWTFSLLSLINLVLISFIDCQLEETDDNMTQIELSTITGSSKNKKLSTLQKQTYSADVNKPKILR